jgi:hypothetical protein
LKLLGCASVAELDHTYVDVPAAWAQNTREAAASSTKAAAAARHWG